MALAPHKLEEWRGKLQAMTDYNLRLQRDPQHQMASWKRHAADEEWQRRQDESDNAKLRAENDSLRDQLALSKTGIRLSLAQVIIGTVSLLGVGAAVYEVFIK